MPTGMIDRRRLIAGAGLAASALALPRFAWSAVPTDRRLLVVILRGAMDGLSAAPAHGDPAFESARNGLAIPRPGQPGGALDLDGFFGLNPALTGLAGRYARKQLVVVHATASPYRDRSHFDAQNLLENGSPRPYGLDDGWLNRALGGLPPAARGGRKDLGVAVAASMPLMLRGPSPVTSWSPSLLPSPDAGLIGRTQALYAAADPQLAAALSAASDAQAQAVGMGKGQDNFPALMAAAARFLTAPDGPCVAVVESSGWDTHAGQTGEYSALQRNLKGLDAGVEALAAGLGEDAWSRTAVLAVTEFGRTVAMNGTGGSDHGTAGAAFLVGGAVNGGRVLADWPGLKPDDLYQGRDLRPTADLRSLFKAALRDHMGVDEARLEREVFPDSSSAKPTDGLFRAA
ncbi:DUF1501 domain-containing protein [Caulobacter sp. KR2-114]|uniref:DUF1501 domain-containing protein n=1 Tax=Caulobacter sp. KR2-114 TaxID=3400912 RepID=UPI003C025DF2